MSSDEPMSSELAELVDRLQRLAEALPPTGSVTLTRADLVGAFGMEEEGELGREPVTISDPTVKEVAAELGRSPSTVRGWAAEIGQAYKLGNEWRIPRTALRRWFDAKAKRAEQVDSDEHDSANLSSWREDTKTKE